MANRASSFKSGRVCIGAASAMLHQQGKRRSRVPAGLSILAKRPYGLQRGPSIFNRALLSLLLPLLLKLSLSLRPRLLLLLLFLMLLALLLLLLPHVRGSWGSDDCCVPGARLPKHVE